MKKKIAIWLVWVNKEHYFNKVAVEKHEFDTNEELAAFYLGLKSAMNYRQSHYRAFDRETEANAYAAGAKAG